VQIATLTNDRLSELVGRFCECRIAVLGDFFLDKYLDVDPALQEVSVETGKLAHQVSGLRCNPGAAGTVVCNLAALGAGTLHAIGVVGDDGEGYDLRKALTQLGCSTEHLHVTSQRHTSTYLKPRDVTRPDLSGEHSRYDTKNREKTPDELSQVIIDSFDTLLPEVDAIAVLDQIEQCDTGVVTLAVRERLIHCARDESCAILWADSRRRIKEFPGLIIKPNQFEIVGIEDPAPDDEVDLETLQAAADQLRAGNQAPVVITCGRRGMLVSDPAWTLVPGIEVTGEIDPTGAGDSVTAGTVLALCAGATLPEAALIGNLVASITIQQLATTGVARPEQLAAQLDRYA